MISVVDFMAILFYVALFILVVILITFVIKAINTLKKIDEILDDVKEKSAKIDGVFNIIDNTTEVITTVNDKFLGIITSGLEKLFKGKRENNE